MIGEYWVSRRTGRIYEVGPRGTRWRVVGHVEDLGMLGGVGTLLGYVGAGLGLGLVASVTFAAMTGLVLGAVLMVFPGAIPFSVPLLFLLLIGVGVRSLVTRRRLAPVLRAGGAFAVVLVLVVLHVLYWTGARPGPYVFLASLPLMPLSTLALAVWAAVRRRWALGSLLLTQTVVYALSYLGSVGSVTYAQSATGVDNLLSLGYWVCLVYVAAAWLTPRRASASAVEEGDLPTVPVSK